MLTENKKNDRIKQYLFLFILFLIEFFLHKNFNTFKLRPELLLISVLFFGFNFGALKGAEIGLVAGILKDMFSLDNFGLTILAFLLIGILAGRIREKIFKDNILAQGFTSAISVYIVCGIHFIFINKYINPYFISEFWQICAHKALYTALVAPVVFFILKHSFPSEEAL